MRTKYSLVSVLGSAPFALVLVCCAVSVRAQTITVPPSSAVNPPDAGIRAATNVQVLKMMGKPGTFQAAGPPFTDAFFETPASIACIYGFTSSVPGCDPYTATENPTRGSKALAVVDAYDDPNAFADLQAFSMQFGLTAITSHSFQVVYAPFGTSTPGGCAGSPPGPQPSSALNTGWDFEESLDIEWTHAMAPGATLYLVEAQSDSFSDLLCAVTVASHLVNKAGGGEVSMSWGSGEWAGEISLDSVFTTPKVVYFAAAGDSPGSVEYPSASPNVVSVGATTLSTNPSTGAFHSENTWYETGGGVSAYEPRPSYQSSIAGIVGAYRGTPDISADGNPDTGVWVLDSLECGGCWFVFGGTSVSTALWAGIVNSAGSFAASTDAELTKLYKDGASDFTDITHGMCNAYMETLATSGWDICSGRGSPKTYSGK